MKRIVQMMMACAMLVTLVSMAAAQSGPQPVVRMGDWVEIGNEAFMNIIGTIDTRFETVHNQDFENDIRDVSPSGNTSANTSKRNDASFYTEIRFGSDFRYQKNLRSRLMLECERTLDGTSIDRDPDDDPAGNGCRVERFWIDYKWAGTPIRMRLGADLWRFDPVGYVRDDDPRFATFLEYPGMTVTFAIGIRQDTGAGNGGTDASGNFLTNDNDNLYYMAGLDYTRIKGHHFGLHYVYYRDRRNSSGDGASGQKSQVSQIIPGWVGKFGSVTAAVAPSVLIGSLDSSNATNNRNFDVLSFGVAAGITANLGMVAPFITVNWGTGDDDPNDSDLKGFTPNGTQEGITGFGGPIWNLNNYGMTEDRAPLSPARYNVSGVLSANTGVHRSTSMYNDRTGNGAHNGVSSTMSNPGTFVLSAGANFYPAKGHTLTAYYALDAITEDDFMNDADPNIRGSAGKILWHELTAAWFWQVNRHFDIRLAGMMAIPGSLTKSLADTVNCDTGAQGVAPGDTTTNRCDGDDVALRGELRVRARF
jgi:hypothetical protein